jgi:hypothetical protein
VIADWRIGVAQTQRRKERVPQEYLEIAAFSESVS